MSNREKERREAALWRLERNLQSLRVKVLAQDGGSSSYQQKDMERMAREIRVLKSKLGREEPCSV